MGVWICYSFYCLASLLGLELFFGRYCLFFMMYSIAETWSFLPCPSGKLILGINAVAKFRHRHYWDQTQTLLTKVMLTTGTDQVLHLSGLIQDSYHVSSLIWAFLTGGSLPNREPEGPGPFYLVALVLSTCDLLEVQYLLSSQLECKEKIEDHVEQIFFFPVNFSG